MPTYVNGIKETEAIPTTVRATLFAGKVSDGKSVQVQAPAGGVVGNKPYMIDSFFGFAFSTAAEGELVALNIEQGEFECAAKTGEDLAVGDDVYYNATDKNLIKTPATGDNYLVGRCTVAQDANDVIWMILFPQNQAVTTV